MSAASEHLPVHIALTRYKRRLGPEFAHLDPSMPALDAATTVVRDAEQRWWAANNRAMQTKGREHRGAVRESRLAEHELADVGPPARRMRGIGRVRRVDSNPHEFALTVRRILTT